MDISRIIQILKEDYSLSELEENLNVTVEDFEDGLLDFIKNNKHEILLMLEEDCYF